MMTMTAMEQKQTKRAGGLSERRHVAVAAVELKTTAMMMIVMMMSR
jgi:hypothetical protein